MKLEKLEFDKLLKPEKLEFDFQWTAKTRKARIW